MARVQGCDPHHPVHSTLRCCPLCDRSASPDGKPGMKIGKSITSYYCKCRGRVGPGVAGLSALRRGHRYKVCPFPAARSPASSFTRRPALLLVPLCFLPTARKGEQPSPQTRNVLEYKVGNSVLLCRSGHMTIPRQQGSFLGNAAS